MNAAPPLVIDCVEFREDLRLIDAASDIAFLAMDLGYRGRGRWAERLLRVYARETDDYELYAVIDYYRSYRAGVRAKVAALSADDSSIPAAQRRDARASARRHLALAGRALAGLGRSRLVVGLQSRREHHGQGHGGLSRNLWPRVRMTSVA